MPHDIYVFGSNGEGQLGEGIAVADIVSKPMQLPRSSIFSNITAIKSGDNHTLLHILGDAVAGIGDNRVGQITGCAGSQIHEFRKLHQNVHLFAAACESSAFAYSQKDSNSIIHTQGRGQWGELGRGEAEDTRTYDSSDPLDVQLPGEMIDFAAGVWHYVAVLADGSVYGWGKARLGQLGDKSSNKVSVPTKIEGLSIKPIRVVCGKDFTYLVSDPSSGEHIVLGKDKFNIISAMPLDIRGWKDVGATWHAIFVLFDDGRLAAWGKDNQWKLIPPDLPKIDKIAIGTDHVLALTKSGKLVSWGWGKHGNCGDLSNIQQEIKNDMISGFWNEIDIPGRIAKIAAGYCTSFVITEVGEDERK
ncbi:alpha tubulin suppressor [Ascochyta rabiei]|uniref:Uncharacterized protein n=1 Tax=Didymella rabiei TaxID=5454 RepID=A0A163M3N9_DIDRA|nr:alpha tubulin suppressor [Ascochyta rabiei]KZM28371.1 hypothetical protein ST47_g507 [Ascochyta rabiei]UPX14688.1 alpha tubulin suppressor [Ascochyta rabiei]